MVLAQQEFSFLKSLEPLCSQVPFKEPEETALFFKTSETVPYPGHVPI